jgi:hypothetical protein
LTVKNLGLQAIGHQNQIPIKPPWPLCRVKKNSKKLPILYP